MLGLVMYDYYQHADPLFCGKITKGDQVNTWQNILIVNGDLQKGLSFKILIKMGPEM